MAAVEGRISAPEPPTPVPVRYPPPVEFAVASLRPLLEPRLRGRLPARWTALRLLEGDGAFLDRLSAALEWDPRADAALWGAVEEARAVLERQGLGGGAWCERVVSALVETAEAIGAASVTQLRSAAGRREQRLDRLLTSRATGIPLMLLLQAGCAAALPSPGPTTSPSSCPTACSGCRTGLSDLFAYLNAPAWLHGALVLGVYRVLAWVVSVMLPPMAIFFPLFTLLEDFGYLPRVAFVLDHAFQRAKACGKQALTMCMGFGCNAAGVVGCRIIDSPRERLIAILTNNFVPCNGRFPPPEKGQIAPPGQQGLQGLPPGGGVGRDGQADFNVSRVIAAHIPRLLFHKAMLLGGKRAARAAPAPVAGLFFLADCFRFS
ncbi:MAG: nucleoside recognition domain-containing protein [Flavonifractor plautii]